MEAHTKQKLKTRLLIRKGNQYIIINVKDIVFFYTNNKLVYLHCCQTGKHVCEKTLAALELQLDKKQFFRANRQYLVNINYIKSYQSINRVNIQLFLNLPDTDHHHIILSQEQTSHFKKWITGEA